MLQRKLIISIIAVIALGILAVGCGDGGDDTTGGEATTGDTSEGGESQRIAASLYSREVPYYQAVAAGIEDQAKQYGWDLNLNFTQPDPSAQTDAIETLLGTQPDGLIMVPIDGAAMVPVAEQALNDGVPVVATGDDFEEAAARSAYVGGDFVEYGRKKAAWIAEELDGEGKVGIIHGIRGITFTEQQNEGLKEVFAEYPDITVVDGPYAGNFIAELGLDSAQNLLTANPDLDAIFFDNDDLALGGAQAVVERGLDPEDVLIVGTDGLEAGLAGLAKGEIDFTLAQCATQQGRQAVIVLKEVIEGGEPESVIITDVFEVTPDNIEEYEERDECKV